MCTMKRENCMSTRNPKVPGHKPGEVCTEFQLHKSQLSTSTKRNLFDYTEFRLKKYIEKLDDEKQKITLTRILSDYKKGYLVIAWKSGRPVWFAITKENNKS